MPRCRLMRPLLVRMVSLWTLALKTCLLILTRNSVPGLNLAGDILPPGVEVVVGVVVVLALVTLIREPLRGTMSQTLTPGQHVEASTYPLLTGGTSSGLEGPSRHNTTLTSLISKVPLTVASLPDTSRPEALALVPSPPPLPLDTTAGPCPTAKQPSTSSFLTPNASLSLGIGSSRSLLLEKGESSHSVSDMSPSAEPVLISFVLTHPTPPDDQASRDLHLLAVDKIVSAFAGSPHSDRSMDDSSSEDLDAGLSVDDDSTLGRYLKDAKSEAMARRAPSKRAKKPKKGRSSPLI